MILTDYQAAERMIANDARNVRDARAFNVDHATRVRAVAACAVRLLLARHEDAKRGGNGLELKAERNLRAAVALLDGMEP